MICTKGSYKYVLLLFVVLIAGCSHGGLLKKDLPKSQKMVPGKISVDDQRAGLPWEHDPEFIKESMAGDANQLIASYHATLPDPILDERHNIALAAQYLKGARVLPGATFSLNQRIGWRSEERGFKKGPMYYGGKIASTTGGGVCKVASVMYNAAVLANQEIVERHPHSMTVPYVPPGQDATISYGTKDFKFRNTTGAPILIWAQNKGDTLYIALYGSYKPPKIKWIHTVISQTEKWTEYTWDAAIRKGEEKTVFEGYDGISVRSEISIDSGYKQETKDMGVSTYIPCPRIVARGSR